MPRGNPSPKLAITVDREVYDAVVKEAAAEGVSVSAWMTAAARKALKRTQALAIMDEWLAELGVTEEDMEEARRRVDAERAAPPVPPARTRRSA